MKHLPIMVLKACSYVGVSLCRLCAPSAFGGRAVFNVDASHFFLYGVLAAIILVGGVAGDGGATACAGCELGVPLCSVAITTPSGAGSAPKFLEHKS